MNFDNQKTKKKYWFVLMQFLKCEISCGTLGRIYFCESLYPKERFHSRNFEAFKSFTFPLATLKLLDSNRYNPSRPRIPISFASFYVLKSTYSLFWLFAMLLGLVWFWLPFSRSGRNGMSSCWSSWFTPLCWRMLLVMLFRPSARRSLCTNGWLFPTFE